MKCSICHQENLANAKFCQECGARLVLLALRREALLTDVLGLAKREELHATFW